ncbi:MAG: hypothetical protein PHY72_03325 [Candidatus Pacebacteria bacterium]|nr:hypothetical protein [Candidatus Paceibacterota bacterium]
MKRRFKVTYPVGADIMSEAVVLAMKCDGQVITNDIKDGLDVDITVEEKNENWKKFFNHAPSLIGVVITEIHESCE